MPDGALAKKIRIGPTSILRSWGLSDIAGRAIERPFEAILAPYIDPLSPNKNTSGYITGHTKYQGAIVGNKHVYLYLRDNMQKIRTTVSGDDGAFLFSHLYPYTQYVVVSLYDVFAEPDENAVVADYITPVTS